MASRTGIQPWRLVILWLLTALIVLLLQSWLFEFSFLAAFASLPLLLVFGLAVFVVLIGMKAWKAALALVAATVLIAVLPLNAAGHQAWTRVSFAQHRGTYETIVERAHDLPDQGRIDGVSYRKDGGLIAFPRSQGMPDGWSAVVYDPADMMTPARQARRTVFESNIQSCIRIEDHWHRCWLD